MKILFTPRRYSVLHSIIIAQIHNAFHQMKLMILLEKVREMNGDGERYKNDLIRTRVEAR